MLLGLSRGGVAPSVVRIAHWRISFFSGALYYGINDIGLAAMGKLLAHEVPDLICALVGDAARGDGRAPGRQLVDDAYVKVTVEGQRQGARNRGRRHDQNIGLARIR